MRRDILRPGLLVVAGALALGAPLSLGWGEVTKSGEPTPRARPEALALGPADGTELRAQCWQEGVKIIDQDRLQGLSLNALTEQQSVSFKRLAEQQPSVFILPFAAGLCLVQPAGLPAPRPAR